MAAAAEPLLAGFTPEDAEQLLAEHFGIQGRATPLNGYRDRNFCVDTEEGRFVLKLMSQEVGKETLTLWVDAMQRLAAAGIAAPQPFATLQGNPWGMLADCNPFWLTRWVEGVPLAEVQARPAALHTAIGALVGQVQLALADCTHPALDRQFQWDLRNGERVSAANFAQLPEAGDRRVLHESLAGVAVGLGDSRHGEDLRNLLAVGPIHGDANDYNLLVSTEGEQPKLSGLIDLEDLSLGWLRGDLAISAAYAMLDQEDPVAVLVDMVRGYHVVSAIPEQELPALWPLACLRMCVSISLGAVARAADPDNSYISVTLQPGLRFLRQSLRISGPEVHQKLRQVCGFGAEEAKGKEQRGQKQRLARRHAVLGPNLSLSYDNPLHMVRGAGRYLFEASGRGYLDAINNVPHVGHGHPQVVQATTAQLHRHNTNTRYLDDTVLEYAEALVATLPAPLSVVHFVNSGSEANELALRLARVHSGGRDFVVLDAAYHGNTQALIDLSPYKFQGPGGQGRQAHVQVATLPDRYRGTYGYDEADAGPLYAQDLDRCLASIAERGAKPAAFLCEAIPGCGGQVVLPPGFLAAAFAKTRASGALCIADEVQTGFGRVGSHFWAFETQGVIPDIVTVGKPMGNGHPLGAVITTPAIASSFHNGMEFFNTFGGNPVACATGLAVLRVLEEEGLQENARLVGEQLLTGLRQLADQHPILGDVRGLGLFLGAVCVRDRATQEPAAEQARHIVHLMRDDGILLSTDGPLHEVIKIKPPLVFQTEDADFLLQRLDSALQRTASLSFQP